MVSVIIPNNVYVYLNPNMREDALANVMNSPDNSIIGIEYSLDESVKDSAINLRIQPYLRPYIWPRS